MNNITQISHLTSATNCRYLGHDITTHLHEREPSRPSHCGDVRAARSLRTPGRLPLGVGLCAFWRFGNEQV